MEPPPTFIASSPAYNKKTACYQTVFIFYFARRGASSPKRHLWWMKRGEDGAVVKITRLSKPKSDFGNHKKAFSYRGITLPPLGGPPSLKRDGKSFLLNYIHLYTVAFGS